jgi:hypothetical protein
MSHMVRVNAVLWEQILVASKKRFMKPTRFIDNAIRRELEGAPIIIENVAAPKLAPIEERVDIVSPLVGNIDDIRIWQGILREAQEEYDGYKNGVAEEDWELEQKSDYVLSCLDRIEQAKVKLKTLVPIKQEA